MATAAVAGGGDAEEDALASLRNGAVSVDAACPIAAAGDSVNGASVSLSMDDDATAAGGGEARNTGGAFAAAAAAGATLTGAGRTVAADTDAGAAWPGSDAAEWGTFHPRLSVISIALRCDAHEGPQRQEEWRGGREKSRNGREEEKERRDEEEGARDTRTTVCALAKLMTGHRSSAESALRVDPQTRRQHTDATTEK